MNQKPLRAVLAALLLAAPAAPALASDTPAAEHGMLIAPNPMAEQDLLIAPAPTAITVTGTVTYEDLEGGFYAVNGWMLMGDEAEFARYLGKQVEVTGTPFDGVTIQMVRALQVTSIQPVTGDARVPAAVRVDGKSLSFDQGPVVADGTLMVPVRFVAEAAGGQVEWLPEPRQVRVQMPDVTVTFTVGEGRAQVNRGDASDLAPNEVPLGRAPEIINSRTLVSVDALALLGLNVSWNEDGSLDVWSEPDAAFTVSGSIAEISDTQGFRFLLKGEAMANGEPTLIWITVPADAAITLGDKAGTTADLKVGQTVEVTLSGPVLESYPARGTALVVRVVANGEETPAR